ncbi:segregation/condensation protein A [Sutcliffiella horikoshii]|uniref:Segregation and condensation protein A n=1 Tax=Sutcliffiella horikoshii TaxID=79883 RepID=A0A5D4T159_9BACI|nr:segregation/condensation protein A [Sutcliffiella horikoshii]TYS68338.1 segregation/condensation protein A [Sutcliffiella horikoshii]
MIVQEYNVKVEAFEGPLDLLLHLINRLEIDIYDIPVAQITEQYLLYIHTMKELQLDVASEYLVMAATLIEIKSKMLLPKHDDEILDEEDDLSDYEEDPREELMNRLIEYRKYKEAADDLKEMEEERSHLFTKPPSDLSGLMKEVKPEEVKLDVSLYDMLGALQKLMRRKKIQKPMQTRITRQEIPIEKRMEELIRDLRQFKGRKHFYELFPESSKEYIVVTFLAILELLKKNSILLEQDNNFSDIYVSYKEGGNEESGYY